MKTNKLSYNQKPFFIFVITLLIGFTLHSMAADNFPGAALDFDGIDDYVEVSDDSSLNATNTLTMEVWVKLDNSSNDQKVVGKSSIGSGYVLGVVNGKLYPEIWDSGGTKYSFQSGSIPSSEWTHLAVTWTTGGQIVGYVNGVQVNSIAASSNPIGTTSNSLVIGAAPWNLSDHRVAGQIEEVRIWNVALSETQIRDNMYLTLDGTESGLVSYWQFNEGAGTTAADNAGKTVR